MSTIRNHGIAVLVGDCRCFIMNILHIINALFGTNLHLVLSQSGQGSVVNGVGIEGDSQDFPLPVFNGGNPFGLGGLIPVITVTICVRVAHYL